MSDEVAPATLIGLARPLRAALTGVDLAPMRSPLLQRVERNPQDAGALLDLSTVLQLEFQRELALSVQECALGLCQLYRIDDSNRKTVLRLLVVSVPGDFMANTPVEVLLEDSDVRIDVLYIAPDLPFPTQVPDCDVIFVAAGEPDLNRAALERIEAFIHSLSRPVLNLPERVLSLTRDKVSALLRGLPGTVAPTVTRVFRRDLQHLSDHSNATTPSLPEMRFPLLVRPVGSHAGKGLARLEKPSEISAFLLTAAEDEFYVSPFVDYRSSDGYYRKYRIAFIDGRPFACHLAISQEWMIHYARAGMAESAAKRDEEAHFMDHFETDFARRHRRALRSINSAIGLDYAVIDCSETEAGELLVFEVDSGAIIHAMDPVDLFPYKRENMQKIFRAFRAMLGRRALSGRLM